LKRIARRSEDVVVGVDQSASGTAAVSLVDGRLADVLFFADTKKGARELLREFGDPGRATFPVAAGLPRAIHVLEPVPVKGDDEVAKTRRLRAIRDALVRFLSRTNPTHVAFEGYSMTRAPVASRVLGEVGGIVRVLLADLGFPFRVYPVESIKAFATGNAAAEKAEMILACRDRWDEPNFTRFGKTEGAAGNLADAYVIAQLLRLELRIRAGEEDVHRIDKVSRDVLLRTTPKRQPVPLLETPFAEVPR
jgi:Holliday junction resolvasome RuvABC endonuclease subunit